MKALLVANRGEIACRIMRTARELGLQTIAVYSDPDRDAPHVRDADRAVALGGSSAAESYLDIAKVLASAERAGADAVHPGYGFLSENAAFARACLDAGLTWVGPRPETIRLMGNKVEAKRVMATAGVPVLEGAAPGDGAAVAFPVLVKAAAGGGGKGMRLVASEAELDAALEAAAREALSSFGDGTVFVERWLGSPRHIEVQVVGDAHGTVVHLGERECSVQRRHQKVVEEAPSPGISERLRVAVTDAAVAGARAIGYLGAGTWEFLVEGDSFYFLEANTRLQVEHPVTEEVTGLDLVRLQLLVADGERLGIDGAEARGHAIEARLYAENPSDGYLPSVGAIERWRPGSTPGIRYDAGIEDGTVVGPYYDSMLAKVIACAPSRAEASARLARALRGLAVHGVRTNRDLLVATLEHPDFLVGATTTDFLDRHPEIVRASVDPDECRLHAVAAALWSASARRSRAPVLGFVPLGWRNVRSAPQTTELAQADGTPLRVAFTVGRNDEVTVQAGEAELNAHVRGVDADGIVIEVDSVLHRCAVHQVEERIWVNTARGQSGFVELGWFSESAASAAAAGPTAPLPGTVVAVNVSTGERVNAGDVLVVLEAMKMEHRIIAHADATVSEVRVTVGDQVDVGQVLVVLT